MKETLQIRFLKVIPVSLTPSYSPPPPHPVLCFIDTLVETLHSY